ncbi:MAG: hypothetical protein RSB90_11660 [Eubacterium sp.]
MTEQIIAFAITAVIGIIAYFLKRTIGNVDDCKADIDTIKEKYATRADIEKIETTIKADSVKFQGDVSRKLDTIQNDLKEVQINYIPKEDFFKEMANFDKKIDRLTDLILDNMKGEKTRNE